MNIFPATLSVEIASLKLQALSVPETTTSDFNSVFAAMASYPFPDSNNTPSGLFALPVQSGGAKSELMAAGRNMSLSDPESAYKMMTLINNKDALYKAQFSELSQMKSYVASMQEAGRGLGGITASTDDSSIKSRLQDFVDQYNTWIRRFNPDMQGGGLLAGTQAAQVSRYELEQSVENIFNGAKDGLHGLDDLGVSIDPNTRLISLDAAKLDAMLATGKQGVVDTIQEFSMNFSKSASLLNSDNNFIPRQLDNLDRVIHYIASNHASLQAEFGAGDAAKPGGQVAQALAAYNQAYGI